MTPSTPRAGRASPTANIPSERRADSIAIGRPVGAAAGRVAPVTRVTRWSMGSPAGPSGPTTLCAQGPFRVAAPPRRSGGKQREEPLDDGIDARGGGIDRVVGGAIQILATGQE